MLALRISDTETRDTLGAGTGRHILPELQPHRTELEFHHAISGFEIWLG